MTTERNDMQRAIRDLAEIRRAIERAERQPDMPISISGLRAQRFVHLAGIVILAVMIVIEYHLNPGRFDSLIRTYRSTQVRYLFVCSLAAMLAAMACGLYLVVWHEARKAGETFEAWVARNFRYLSSLSFLSDLFVKFSSLALMILARRPDWVAPLLAIFTGDYLIQGRFFLLPVRMSLLLGFLCVAFGTVQCLFLPGSLLYPFAIVLVVLVLSYLNLLRLASSRESQDTAG